MRTDMADAASGRPAPLVAGVLLIVLGLFFLAVNFLDVEFAAVWPVTLLVPALAFFLLAARDRRQRGLLMPATVLLVLAVLFFACQAFGWEILARLWPLFMIAPGLGFFLLYLAGGREQALLVPAFVLTGLGGVFLLVNYGWGSLWPAVLILAGVLLLLRRRPAPPEEGTPPVPGQ